MSNDSVLSQTAILKQEILRLRERESDLQRQLDALHEMSSVISSAAGLKEVAEGILDALGRVVEYRKATIQLIQEDFRHLVAYRGFKPEGIDKWLLRPISKDQLIGQLVNEKKPLILSDPTLNPLWEVRSETRNVRSWACLPLIYGQDVIGLLTIDHDQPGFYTSVIEKLLMSFARQATIAVKKALLFDDTQRRIRDLQILNDVAESMATQLNTNDLLDSIVSQITNQLHCARCTIFLAKGMPGKILLEPHNIQGKESTELPTFHPGEGMAGSVFEEGEPVLLPDANSDARFLPADKNPNMPRSMLIMPIKAGEKTIGVISADQDQYGGFNENDLSLLQALARQAGIAIQRNQGLELLQDISQRINSMQETEEILHLIVQGAIELTHTTDGIIYQVNPDTLTIEQRAIFPPDSFQPAPRMDDSNGMTHRIIASGEMEVYEDIRLAPHINPIQFEYYASMIGMPLKHERNVLGVLYLDDRDRHKFTDLEISLLTSLANQAATALHTARLVHDLEHQVKGHQTLNEVGAKLTGMLDEDKILNEIADSVADTLDCDHCSVFRVEPTGLVVRAVHGSRTDALRRGRTFAIGQGVAGWVAQHGQSALVPDTNQDERFDPSWSETPPKSLVVAPILVDQNTYGVISVENSRCYA